MLFYFTLNLCILSQLENIFIIILILPGFCLCKSYNQDLSGKAAGEGSVRCDATDMEFQFTPVMLRIFQDDM